MSSKDELLIELALGKKVNVMVAHQLTAIMDGIKKTLNQSFNCDNIDELKGQILCERPNSSIYKFDGHYQLEQSSEKIQLNASNLLLRGMSLRNTDHVHGLVVFTGHETKVMKNNTQPKYKFSRLELLMNLTVKIIILF